MKAFFRRFFLSRKRKKRNPGTKEQDNDNVIELDTRDRQRLLSISRLLDPKAEKKGFGSPTTPETTKRQKISRVRSKFERFAYEHLAGHLPILRGYREAYEQSGIPLVYESFLSKALLASFLITLPAFVISLLFEVSFLRLVPAFALLGSFVFSTTAFALSFFLWLLYPLQRRKNFKTKLENQLAYSFGILGVLAAAGISVERLFEGISSSESNPVLSDLANRFLRNVKVFGMDTESALKEVATHSPSEAFSKMLESIGIAFRTTGSIHDLVMFESSRLFNEKREKLKKSVASLAVMAELYITLVVVGPIIFIVMLTIFLFLPSGGAQTLPDPTLLINVMIFVAIPAISAMLVVMLDSMVAKV